MSLHSRHIIHALTSKYCVLSGEEANISLVFGLIRPGFESTIYQTQGQVHKPSHH